MKEPRPEGPKQQVVRPPAKPTEEPGANTPLPIEKLHKIQKERDKAGIEGIKARLNGFDLEKDQQKAHKLVEKKDVKLKEKGVGIDNPMARFNLNLDDQNPDIQTTPESGLEPYAQRPLTEKLRKELETPEKIIDPATGQKFNVLKLNWKPEPDKETGRVLVFLPAYNVGVDHPLTNYRIEEVARQLQIPVLAIEHPGMGKSDKLTKEQKAGLKGEEGYGLIADAQLRAMKEQGITEIDVAGSSMGGWAAASLAERAATHGIRVKHAIIMDSPGVKEMDPDGIINELSKSEMEEGKYIDLYTSAPYDPQLRYAAEYNRSRLSRAIGLGLWAARSLVADPGGVYKKAMSRATLENTLEDALATNPDLKVRLVNGSKSEVSPSENNKKIATNLREKFPDRVGQSVYSGEPHMFTEHAKRFATQVGLAIHN